jgi:hypothetical protein
MIQNFFRIALRQLKKQGVIAFRFSYSCDGVEEVRIRHLFSFFAYTLQLFIHFRWADHFASVQIVVNPSVHLGF